MGGGGTAFVNAMSQVSSVPPCETPFVKAVSVPPPALALLQAPHANLFAKTCLPRLSLLGKQPSMLWGKA